MSAAKFGKYARPRPASAPSHCRAACLSLTAAVSNSHSAPCTAFVAHVMGTCLASLAPISSWVGLEIGYVSALYSQLGGTWASLDPFVGLMQASALH